MTWIDSNGGPLVLLDDKTLADWIGTGSDDWEPGAGTDYDRACEVSEWIDVLNVGEGTALVLGADPTATRAIELPSGVLLLRWIQAPMGWQPPDPGLLSEQSWEHSSSWEVRGSAQVLQDAAFPGGDKAAPHLWLRLTPGRYEVYTAEYRPVPEVWMILHWLRTA